MPSTETHGTTETGRRPRCSVLLQLEFAQAFSPAAEAYGTLWVLADSSTPASVRVSDHWAEQPPTELGSVSRTHLIWNVCKLLVRSGDPIDAPSYDDLNEYLEGRADIGSEGQQGQASILFG